MSIYGEVYLKCYKPFIFGHDRIDFLMAKKEEGKTKEIAENIVFREINNDEFLVESTSLFSLTVENAQILMDNLWDCGLRPSEGSGSAGAMKATQNHLEDMRKLAGVKS